LTRGNRINILEETPVTEENHLQLQLTIRPSLIGKFSGILQQGFAFRTRVGISIDTLLCDDLGLDRQYVEEKISTVFLDGKAVDSLETILLRDRSTRRCPPPCPVWRGPPFAEADFTPP